MTVDGSAGESLHRATVGALPSQEHWSHEWEMPLAAEGLYVDDRRHRRLACEDTERAHAEHLPHGEEGGHAHRLGDTGSSSKAVERIRARPRPGPPLMQGCKKSIVPDSEHRRQVLLGVGAIFGLFIALIIGWSAGAAITYSRSFGADSQIGEIFYGIIALIAVLVFALSGRRARRGDGLAAAIALASVTYLGAFAVGIVFGPPYVAPDVIRTSGTLELRLSAPISAQGSTDATCWSIADALDFDGVSAIDFEFAEQPLSLDVGTHARRTNGDSRIPDRSDRISLMIQVNSAGDPPPFWEAGPETDLVLIGGRGSWSGAIRFSDLQQVRGPGSFGVPAPLSLAGEVAWDCGTPSR